MPDDKGRFDAAREDAEAMYRTMLRDFDEPDQAKVIGGKNILLIASTDMSHYYPYDTARSMDDIALSSIKRMDTAQLMDDLGSGDCELCGSAPVLTVLMTAEKLGADGVEILQYANSGDVTGDKSQGVVGYFAAAIYQKTDS